MYQLTEHGVIRLADNAHIPQADGNRDWAEYQQWLADGNTPEPIPGPTEQQLRETWKQERAAAVAAITVTVDGMIFDGDETSQTRMARSISVMNDTETNLWVLADNKQVQVTKAQLHEALRLAGQRQTELWVQA